MAKLVNAVAGIRLEKKGFTVASETRCVTPDAQCSAGMDFAFEDITYGFNGKIKRRSKEYASKEIQKRYGESLNNLRGLGMMRAEQKSNQIKTRVEKKLVQRTNILGIGGKRMRFISHRSFC